jgi:hypothetical protein
MLLYRAATFWTKWSGWTGERVTETCECFKVHSAFHGLPKHLARGGLRGNQPQPVPTFITTATAPPTYRHQILCRSYESSGGPNEGIHIPPKEGGRGSQGATPKTKTYPLTSHLDLLVKNWVGQMFKLAHLAFIFLISIGQMVHDLDPCSFKEKLRKII